MSKVNAAKEVERLIQFAEKQNMVEKSDEILCRNALMDLLNIEEPYYGKVEEEALSAPTDILERVLDYAVERGLISENTATNRDIFDTRIMGLLMPRQSEVIRSFCNSAAKEGIEEATDKFYLMSKASNYIRMDRIEKNLYWLVSTDFGELEITVNLSKPEKDPKEIAAVKASPESKYPKCLLCIENVGYAGHIGYPARQNHRVIPVKLANENFYFQYSPYAYYNEHCIVFLEQHIPMKIFERTFMRLFDFVEQFPHYFIGSNADLPIVGGSILTHEHFQGGRHIFPMEKAQMEKKMSHTEYPDIKCGILRWPMSVIRLSGMDKEKLIKLSVKILNTWREYSDKELGIIAYSQRDVPHNTITPIARKNSNGEFEIDLVLRNNRTTEEYPDGIFHPHKELHHIKKENIGLIEVMGLAILPARLNTELIEISRFLTSNKSFCKEAYDENHPLYKHMAWIEELIRKYGTHCDDKDALQKINREVGDKFLKVLLDAGVYKKNFEGTKGFIRFMESLGFKKI